VVPDPSVQRDVGVFVQQFRGRLPKERFESIAEFASAGEEGVALENLIDNLLDHDVGISQAQLKAGLSLASRMGMDTHVGRFEHFRGLIHS
jgi:hypothetical protein